MRRKKSSGKKVCIFAKAKSGRRRVSCHGTKTMAKRRLAVLRKKGRKGLTLAVQAASKPKKTATRSRMSASDRAFRANAIRTGNWGDTYCFTAGSMTTVCKAFRTRAEAEKWYARERQQYPNAGSLRRGA